MVISLFVLLFPLLTPAADLESVTAPTEPPTPKEVLIEQAGSYANLIGLPEQPDESHAPTTSEEVKAAPGGDEPGCKTLPPALRAMVFRHFQNFQELQNAQGHYLPERAADKAAHLLGMVPKESSGDSASVTDMRGKEYGSYQAITSLDRWKNLFGQKNITYNKQTNYGLAQQSMDRMQTSFKIQTGKLDDFLATGDNANSGQNVRRILDVYQHFAQGRIIDKDRPIPEAKLKDPKAPAELKERAHGGIQSALWHCGTRFLFKEGYAGAEGLKQLEDAMASIAYCDIGSKKPDPNNKAQAQCFAKWVTLCPALNLDIGLLNPDSYFATRKAAPLCKATFLKMIKKAPGAK